MSDSESSSKNTTGRQSDDPTQQHGISAGGSSLSKTPTYIATYTGSFDFAHPSVDDIHPLDIAHALAQIPRFGGHAPRFYSVAQHCINVARTLANRGYPREVQLKGLLHDAGEAYIGDIVTPWKQRLHGISEVEDELLSMIYQKAGLEPDEIISNAAVKHADRDNLMVEARTLFEPAVYERYFSYLDGDDTGVPYILPVSYTEAEGMYLAHYVRLIRPRVTYKELYDERRK